MQLHMIYFHFPIEFTVQQILRSMAEVLSLQFEVLTGFHSIRSMLIHLEVLKPK